MFKFLNLTKFYKKILLYLFLFFLFISFGFLLGNHFSWEDKKGFYWDGPKTFLTYMKKKYYVQKPVNPLNLNSKDIEIKNLNKELDTFKKTIEENNTLYESMLDKTTQSLEKIISNTESLSKIQ